MFVDERERVGAERGRSQNDQKTDRVVFATVHEHRAGPYCERYENYRACEVWNRGASGRDLPIIHRGGVEKALTRTLAL